MLSRIYIAASSRDTRFARICAASVRTFAPDLPVFLLPGGKLERGLAEELKRHWNVGLAEIPPGDYGWGFVKLEPLFGPPGEPFLMLDADTVLTGPVIEAINARLTIPHPPAFLVDEEDQPEAEMRRLYYDWDRLREIDPGAARPAFVFNSGQWVGTPGLLTRADFVPWVEWSFPRRLRHPGHFMPGDQGILNYVLNQSSASGRFRVEPMPLMRWPGHGMEGFDAASVAAGKAPARVVHWAGLKRLRFVNMPGADLLEHFERVYYSRVLRGPLLRSYRALWSFLSGLVHSVSMWFLLFWKLKVSGKQQYRSLKKLRE